MDHATELRGADDVVYSDAGDFFRRCCKIRWQMLARGMRTFLVVVPTPNSADVIQMLFCDDHKLVQTFELQSLDESFDMGSQIG